MIHLTATFIAKPECIKELEAALKKMVAPSRQEPGCIRYCLFSEKDDPAKFTFQESFKDEESFEVHCRKKYFSDLLAEIPSLTVGDPEIKFYNEL